MKCRMILEILFIFVVVGISFRLGFVEGHNEVNFDRETATRQIQNCNDLIVHNKLNEG